MIPAVMGMLYAEIVVMQGAAWMSHVVRGASHVAVGMMHAAAVVMPSGQGLPRM